MFCVRNLISNSLIKAGTFQIYPNFHIAENVISTIRHVYYEFKLELQVFVHRMISLDSNSLERINQMLVWNVIVQLLAVKL